MAWLSGHRATEKSGAFFIAMKYTNKMEIKRDLNINFREASVAVLREQLRWGSPGASAELMRRNRLGITEPEV